MLEGVVIFNLKKLWTYPGGKTVHLYEEIKSGRKTSEWRDLKSYWMKRLLKQDPTIHLLYDEHLTADLTGGLRVQRAWFVTGYPKGNIPRLEAYVTGIIYHGNLDQLEIKFMDAMEVKNN